MRDFHLLRCDPQAAPSKNGGEVPSMWHTTSEYEYSNPASETTRLSRSRTYNKIISLFRVETC